MEKVITFPYAVLVLLLLTFFSKPSYALYDVTRYCHLIPIGTKLPSLESCHVYFSCQPDGYIEHSCNSQEYFHKDTQSCKPSHMVKCYADLEHPCSKSNAEFVENVQNCRGFISCKNNTEVGRANCPDGQIFDAERQVCRYGICENEMGSIVNGGVENICSIMQANKFFGDIQNCQTWNICKQHGKLAKGSCENGLVFDTQSRMCLRNDGEMCTRLEVPDFGCNRLNEGSLNGDSFSCSQYYRCDGKNWRKFNCPNGEYFDVLQKTCIIRQTATPMPSCNRCQYFKGKWANAVDTQCSRFFTCKNGRIITEGSCGTGGYFNEERQVCIFGATDISEYRRENGACKGETTTLTTIMSSLSSSDATEDQTTTPISSVPSDTTPFTATENTPDITTDSIQEKCHPYQNNTFKTDPSICSVFYRCNGNVWIKYLCPSQQYFDMATQECTERQKATTNSECDRCQFAASQWVNAVDVKCSKYLICINGHRVAQNSCGDESYFDEEIQACVIGENSLREYRKNNTACKEEIPEIQF